MIPTFISETTQPGANGMTAHAARLKTIVIIGANKNTTLFDPLGTIFSLEINLSIVAAVLTIVGYSMNDTVVIFDRVRENLKKYSDIKIFELTNISINETLSRTIITSATTLFALLAIYFFGGEILKGFSLAMILGVVFGTYSSIYIANTVLVRLNVTQKTVLREDKE